MLYSQCQQEAVVTFVRFCDVTAAKNHTSDVSVMAPNVGHLDRQIDGQIDRWTDRRIDRQIDRWTDRRIDRQIDR